MHLCIHLLLYSVRSIYFILLAVLRFCKTPANKDNQKQGPLFILQIYIIIYNILHPQLSFFLEKDRYLWYEIIISGTHC